MENMNSLTPDEALYAFMDGELELPEEQRLFDELAAKPDLRTEMKDILSIRGAVHRDVIFPSPAVESSLLAAAGLAPAAGAVVGAAVAASSAWIRPLIATLGGAVAGGLIVYFAMLGSGATQSAPTDIVGVTGGTITERPTMQMLVPVRRDTVFVKKYVPVQAQVPPTAPVAMAPLTSEADNTESDVAITTASFKTTPSAQDLGMSTPLSADNAMMEGMTLTDKSSLPQVTLRVRSLPSGMSAGTIVPTAMSNTLFTNAGFALLFPVSKHQHVGVEMGQETWPQTYQGTVNGMPVEYTQTPALFWIGATYRHAFAEFNFVEGLRPFAEITGGFAWSQGPLGRAQAGLSYQPSSAIAFTLGVDVAGLNYNNQGQNFTSFKWGATYGVVINMGALR
ncbi:hypothetical protein BH10BAC6_BH10BAC6_00150 [soil metagenome]